MKKTMIIMLAAVCAVMNARAGDLTTDNLTVMKDAKFYGNVDITKLSIDAPPTNGLVLFYNFQTNATPVQDASGNGYTATVYGATWTSDGKLNGGTYIFDGVDDYISTSLTNLSGSEISITYWFKGSTLSSAVRQQASGVGDYVIAGWTGGGAPQHILSNDGGTTGGLSVDGNGGSTVNNGSWHHVAMTWKQNTANGFVSYLDGAKIASRISTNTAISNYATPVELGRYQGGGSEKLNGRLDELRIYNRALTSNEIYSLYAEGADTNGGAFTVQSMTVSNGVSQVNGSATNSFMGNVGIGTSSPGVPMEVASTSSAVLARFNKTSPGAQSPFIELQSNGTTGMRVGNEGASFESGVIDHNYANAENLIFKIRGVEKMRINNDTKVGIGTNSPAETLDVNGKGRFQQGVSYVYPLGDLGMGVYTNQ